MKSKTSKIVLVAGLIALWSATVKAYTFVDADGGIWTWYSSSAKRGDDQYVSGATVSGYQPPAAGCPEAIAVPATFDEVWTNSWNEWVGEELVTRETVYTNTYKTVKLSGGFGSRPELRAVHLPTTVVELGNSVFADSSSLETIIGLDNVTRVGQAAFQATTWLANNKDEAGFVVLHDTLFACEGTAETTYVPEGVKYIGSVLAGTQSKKVVLPSTVTRVPDNAFSGNNNFESIVFNGEVTDIGQFAFYFCTSLEEIEIPEAVRAIPWYAFYGCSSLRAIRGGRNVTSVSDTSFLNTPLTDHSADDFALGIVGNVLFGYKGTPRGELVIPEGVATALSSCFEKCAEITSVTFPSTMTAVSAWMFRDCDELVSAALPPSIRSIGTEAFAYCPKFATVTGAEGVTSIGADAFIGTLFIDNQEGDFVMLGGVLLECWADGDVVIPETVKQIGTGNYDNVFINKDRITSLTFPAGLDVSLWQLRSFTALEGIYFSGEHKDYVSVDGILYDKDMIWLMYCPRGRTGGVTVPEGVLRIASDAFSGCEGLEAVEFPEALDYIGSCAFSDCAELESIDIPPQVISLPYDVFSGCSCLAEVTGGEGVRKVSYSAFDGTACIESAADGFLVFNGCLFGFKGKCPANLVIPEGVTAIPSWLFEGCKEIESISLPTTLRKIGSGVFSGCPELKAVFGGEAVEEVGYDAFYGTPFQEKTSGPVVVGQVLIAWGGACPSELVIPEGVVTIADSLFEGKSEIVSVSLPDSLVTIGACAFNGCTNLATVSGGANLSRVYGYGADGGVAFDGTPFVQNAPHGPVIVGKTMVGYSGAYPDELTIPEGVESIAGFYKEDQGDLRVLRLPDSLVRIGYDVFSLATNLMTVTGGANLREVASSAFGWVDDENSYVGRQEGFVTVGSVLFGYSSPKASVESAEKTASVVIDGVLRIPDGVKVIAQYAFSGEFFEECEALKRIELPASVEYVASYAFAWCPNLREVSFENPDVVVDDRAFEWCEALTKVEVAPKVGFVFDGWQDAEGCRLGTSAALFGLMFGDDDEETTSFGGPLSARWLARTAPVVPTEPIVQPEPVLFAAPTTGVFDGGDTYTGWIKDASGDIVGTITIKAGKPGKNGSKLTATVQMLGQKKLTLKGEADVGEGVTAYLTGKDSLATVTFGSEGMVGTLGDYTIDGARNVFMAKDDVAKAKADEFERWYGTYNVAMRADVTTGAADGWSAMSVTLGKKGVAKISGVMADGTKISAKAQAMVGETGAFVPVLIQLYSGKKGGFAFLLWIDADGQVRVDKTSEWNATGSKKPFAAEWVEVLVARHAVGASPVVSAFVLPNGDPAFAGMEPMPALSPNGEPVTVKGVKWVTDKASRVDKDGNAAGGNPSALKLTYTAKTGLFKGTYSMYYREVSSGKVKKAKATINGAVVGTVGYGAAVIKNIGSFPVLVK